MPGSSLHSTAAESDEAERDEFWARLDTELGADLDDWPPAAPSAAAEALEASPAQPSGDGGAPAGPGAVPRPLRRELVDRREASGIATVAALASSGDALLVVCADALRRRALVERAVRPARFGGGDVALVAARLPLGPGREALARLLGHGSGVALVDWPALAADPALTAGFTHVVVVDPAPFAHLDRLARAGPGYLHQLAPPGDLELTLRALAEEWPGRESLRFAYRALRRAAGDGGGLAADAAHAALGGGSSPHPRSPEAAARRLRVLVDLDLARLEGSGAGRELRVVSSEGKDLDRSAAFVAYRARHEEAERYLSAATRSSS